MKNKVITFLILLPISLVLSVLFISSFLKLNSTNLKDFISGNILINSNFKEGLKYWRFDNRVSLTNIENKIYAHVKGINQKQTRFWQDIEVVSGRVYRLKFDLKGKQTGAFAIYRDNKTGKESYIWCKDDSKTKKSYSWEIIPDRTGKNTVYLSTNLEGDYYYSNIRLLTYLKKDFHKSTILVVSIFLITVFLCLMLSLVRYNIIFTMLMLVLIIIPASKINNETVSKIENRTLAKMTSLFEKGRINTSFGKDFNEYLNDRFFARKILIDEFTDLKYNINRRFENNKAIQGKDGWLFEKFDPDSFLLINNYDKLIVTNILKLQNQCENLGIKIYFASIPEKNSVYGKYNHYIFQDEKLSKALKNNKLFNFIFLLDEFKKEKDNGYLYFKDDHHFTERGAYIYSKKLIDLCKQEYPILDELNIEDFNVKKIKNTYNDSITFQKFEEHKDFVGSIRNLLNLDKNSYSCISYYEAYRHKKYEIPKTELSETIPFYSIYRNNDVNNRIKIMILGDSNIAFMVPFITSIFSESLFLQVNERRNYGWYLKSYFKTLKDFKPDVVLLIVRSSNLKRWTELTEF